jgi:hypothetical protein
MVYFVITLPPLCKEAASMWESSGSCTVRGLCTTVEFCAAVIRDVLVPRAKNVGTMRFAVLAVCLGLSSRFFAPFFRVSRNAVLEAERRAKMEKIQNVFADLTGAEKTGFIDWSQESLYRESCRNFARLWLQHR